MTDPAARLPQDSPDTDLIRQFLDRLRFEEGLSAHTVSAYQRDLIKVAQALRPTSLQHAGADDLDEVLLRLSSVLGARSLARLISALKRFYRFACLEKRVQENPSLRLVSPVSARSLPSILSEAQVTRLLNAPDLQTPLGKRDAAMLELMYATGLRVSEMVALNFMQINLSAGWVQVVGKGRKERLVPMGEWAQAALQRYLDQARSALVGQKQVETVFVSRLGRPMTRQTLWHRIKNLAAQAGLPGKLSPHSLRHAFATHLINHGADLRSVQAFLGHSDLSTTQIYTHVAQARLQNLHRQHHPRG
ncbi:MAG: site-specific tyrosine recombinase XerD [Hydrogenovibrio sp.]|uniref:site-specific tyrosine recombinase XerD n=1 Tax=Hydrogenovibrio TaxID=28884 RepID=UPI00036AECBC|nr:MULTISPECIES: site-specific tyrosine recombinase XerD [Hydrogenovibrio]MDR9498087.1 site-specific tyrosine recombinase XerD [Hydrogenovibrio sp.]